MWPSIAYSLRSYLKHEIAQGNELQKVSTVYNLKFCGQHTHKTSFSMMRYVELLFSSNSLREKQNVSTHAYATTHTIKYYSFEPTAPPTWLSNTT